MPIPQDKSFNDLRDANYNALVRGKLLDGPPRAARIERFESLLTDRQQIEELASTHTQREFYDRVTEGRSGWTANFIRMRDLHLMLRAEALCPGSSGFRISEDVRQKLVQFFSEPSQEHSSAATMSAPLLPSAVNITPKDLATIRNKLWEDLQRSRFKSFQELFCDPMNFAVPMLSSECIPRSLNTCNLAPCLVSPDRMPSKLLSDLGLVQWPEERITQLDVLQTKGALKVVNGLKALWESTEKIDSKSGRIMIVKPHTDAVLSFYGASAGGVDPSVVALDPIRSDLIGSLLYVREEVSGSSHAAASAQKRGEFLPQQRVVHFHATAYSLIRKTHYQRESHDNEISELAKLTREWKDLNQRINSEWKPNTSMEHRQYLHGLLCKLAEETHEKLAADSNVAKSEAFRFLIKIEEQLAITPRNLNLVIQNIAPILTQMVSSFTRLDLRSGEIPQKGQWNEVDRMVLNRSIEEHEVEFQIVEGNLLAAPAILRDYEYYFTQAGLSREKRTQEANKLIGRMNLGFGSLSSNIKIRPFIAFAEKLRSCSKELHTAIVNQTRTGVRDAIVKMVVVCKLQQTNAAFEVLRRRTIERQTVPLQELVKVARELAKVVGARELFPEHTVVGYSEPYGVVEQKVKDIKRTLLHYEDMGLDLTARKVHYKNLREYLDLTDLEDIVRKLP